MPLLQIIIFSLPLYLARLSIFGLKTNVLDVLLILLTVYSLFAFRFSLFANTRVEKLLSPIALIIIGATISTINSSDVVRSLGILKSYFILPILFLFAISSIIKTQEQKEKILKAWFLGGFIVALISLFYWLVGELTYDGRLRAFFESPNQLAMFLAPAVIIGTYFIFFNWVVIPVRQLADKAPAGIQDKKIWIPDQENKECIHATMFSEVLLWCISTGMTAIIGAAIFLTKSLGAIASITISLSLFFIFYSLFYSLHLSTHRRTKMGSNFLSTAIIILLLVVGCLLLVIEKDFSERSSLASRVIVWQSAGVILKDSWLLGIGPGTFQEKYLEYQKYFPPYLEWASPQPHNVFLAFWLQTGIVGFAGFLWLIFIFFKNVWQNKKDNVVLLSGILMIYTLIHGLIDTTYWKNDLAIIFWVIILLSLSLEPVKSSTQQD